MSADRLEEMREYLGILAETVVGPNDVLILTFSANFPGGQELLHITQVIPPTLMDRIVFLDGTEVSAQAVKGRLV